MCGGLGTRLRPVTESVPKALVDIGGRPFIHYILSFYGPHFGRIFLLAGHLGEQLKPYEEGKVRVVIEKHRMGTGGAVIHALDLVSEDFAVANGDTFIEGLQVNDFLSSCGGRATIAITKGETREKGHVLIDKDRVVSFNEKSREGEGYVYAGFGYFRKSLFSGYPVKEFSLEKDFLPSLAAKKMLYHYTFDGEILDIGTFSGLRRFREFIKEGK